MFPISKRYGAARGFAMVGLIALATALLSGLVFWPQATLATITQPTLPLTVTIVQNIYNAQNCGSGNLIGTNPAIPPDRQIGGSNNRYTGLARDGMDNTTNIVLWANADQDPKELTLDISGQNNVINGDVVSRSHLKVGSSDSIFLDATEYGTRSAGKPAFDMSGQNNCYNLEPDQVPRNAPPAAPAGFPYSNVFDPNNDGNILEHFAPGSPAAVAANALGQYYTCPFVADTSPVPTPLSCSSGNLVGSVQNTEMPTGLYYVTGEVNLSASNLQATVTIVSGSKMSVSGSS